MPAHPCPKLQVVYSYPSRRNIGLDALRLLVKDLDIIDSQGVVEIVVL